MSYDDKLFTVRKIVDKVIATKEQITICGNIPSYANSVAIQKVGLNVKHSQLQDTTKPNTEVEVGLDAKHWHSDFLTQLPFELKLDMPATDRGRRGYSNDYVYTLIKGVHESS